MVFLDRVLIERVSCRTNSTDNIAAETFVQRFPQPADMHVDGADFDIAIMTPDAVEQPLARENMAGIFKEMLEQPVFGRS